ncbi:MAG: DNA polymerase III subunit delta [Tidjanibacter sp.]|nr:DNA polymerase III subunit delta [Tidjanibacter sp.]
MAKGVKFRDSYAQYEQIVANVKAGKVAPVYLLMGEEGFFIDSLTDLLAESLLEEHEKAFNQIIVYGKDTDEGTIINHARQMPMMGRRMVIIVKDAASLRKIDTLGLYTASPSPTTVLVVACKGKSVDKRSQFYKHTAAKGVVFESTKPYDNELGPWLGAWLRKHKGCAIEEKALRMVVDYMGVDISKIINEIEKLLVSLPEGTKAITADHIEQNIGISKEYNNYELVEAIARKDFAKAMRIADYFARNPKNNPMVVTVSTLFSYFQKLFIINYKEWQTRVKGMPATSTQELSSLLKVHPFLLEGYLRAAKLYPNKKIFVILGLIREYDMKNKGIGGGGATEGDLLRELLMKIMML